MTEIEERILINQMVILKQFIIPLEEQSKAQRKSLRKAYMKTSLLLAQEIEKRGREEDAGN